MFRTLFYMMKDEHIKVDAFVIGTVFVGLCFISGSMILVTLMISSKNTGKGVPKVKLCLGLPKTITPPANPHLWLK